MEIIENADCMTFSSALTRSLKYGIDYREVFKPWVAKYFQNSEKLNYNSKKKTIRKHNHIIYYFFSDKCYDIYFV